jgi:hypothetical protein
MTVFAASGAHWLRLSVMPLLTLKTDKRTQMKDVADTTGDGDWFAWKGY